MTDLSQGACVPCRGGVPTLTPDEMAELSPQVPNWQIVEQDAILRLRRDFRFGDFRQALDFAVQVGELAEWDPLESTCRHASLSIL